ncbi:MAG TPA: DUF3995 domain-containing protein [Hyphomicrobiales bacterium]|nr:DUF3995 domain-containing protein [Hyphomicrobiales bacterium]
MFAVLIVAIGLTATLWALAALHVYWGDGGLWPEKDPVALARTVVGAPGVTQMPSRTACFAVALALFIAGLWPLDMTGVVPVFVSIGLSVLAGYVLAAVFLVRGVAAYLPIFRKHFPEEPFATNDRRLYGPLCLLIGAGFLFLLSFGWSGI